MATIKKIQIRTDDGNDYGTILHPETSADMVIDEETGQTLTAHLADTSAHGIDTLEKMLVKSMYSLSQIYTGEFGDMVVSTNTTIPLGISTYNNLTINSGATLTCLRGVSTIFVKDTLTLNGVISANGLGARRTTAGDQPYGGAGGGIVIVMANKILGIGTITANGEDGQTGGGSSGTERSGNEGKIYGYTINAGGSGSYGYRTGGTIDFEAKQTVFPLLKFLLPLLPTLSIGGASGATGGWRSSSLDGRSGGGGGAGLVGDGGNGGLGINGGIGDSTSGGGGGGGGGVFVLSLNGIPSIKLSAKGGNGGNGTTDETRRAGGGGGGGGGFVGVWAPSSNAIIDVTGGRGGKNATTSDRGEDGKPGLAYFKSI